MDIAISKNKVPIRLTDERWYHITTGHPEIADYYYQILETIENPEMIYQGDNDGLIAIRLYLALIGKYIVVVYKETNQYDGFVITAYISNKIQTFTKKIMIWKQF